MPAPGPLELLLILLLVVMTYGVPLLIVGFFIRRMIKRTIDPLQQEVSELRSELDRLKKKIE